MNLQVQGVWSKVGTVGPWYGPLPLFKGIERDPKLWALIAYSVDKGYRTGDQS